MTSLRGKLHHWPQALLNMSQYDPDAFTLSKAELVAKMELFNARIQRNPLVEGKVKKYVTINMALLKSRFVSERDMRYGLQLLCEFCDDIRALNVRRGKPELKEINPIFEASIEKKIALTPEEIRSEKPKVLVDFTKNLRFGGMKNA